MIAYIGIRIWPGGGHATVRQYAILMGILLGWLLLTFILWLFFGGKSK
jgi:hypothetical protein